MLREPQRFGKVRGLIRELAGTVNGLSTDRNTRSQLALEGRVQVGRDQEPPAQFRETFNTWEVRFNTLTNRWAISSRRLGSMEWWPAPNWQHSGFGARR